MKPNRIRRNDGARVAQINIAVTVDREMLLRAADDLVYLEKPLTRKNIEDNLRKLMFYRGKDYFDYYELSDDGANQDKAIELVNKFFPEYN